MRHRHRRFGAGPYLTGMEPGDGWGAGFPFGVPAVAAIEALDLDAPITLLAIVVRAAEAGAQFVIGTHSPILLATPAARIYELDERGLALTDYDDLEAVRFTRGFLGSPERFIRAALGE